MVEEEGSDQPKVQKKKCPENTISCMKLRKTPGFDTCGSCRLSGHVTDTVDWKPGSHREELVACNTWKRVFVNFCAAIF